MTTVILCNGGIRSLVATAIVAAERQAASLVLLHFKREDATSPVRLDHVRRQAEHFGIEKVTEIPHPALPSPLTTDSPLTPPIEPLRQPQLLMLGIAHASKLTAKLLIWPIQFDGDHGAIAQTTELIVLVKHIVQLEEIDRLAVETPLLDLTDQQVIELGAQLNVPFEKAWNCLAKADRACGSCVGCRRRRTAFHAAGMVDPADRFAPVG